MSRAVHQVVVMTGWLVSLACAVYEPSLLGGQSDDRAAAGASRGGDGSGESSSGASSSAGSSSIGPGGGGGSSAGSFAAGAAPTTGGSGQGGVVEPGAGGAPDGQAGAGAPPIGGSGPDLVFDTMEDGNHVFFLTSTERGRWYLSHDGTDGEQTALADLIDDIPGGRDGSSRAVHVVSSGFSSWGASVGFTFEDNTSGDRVPFDASGFSGISFFARVEAGSATAVRVNFPDLNTDPLGEVCLSEDAGTEDCLDHFGTDLQLTTEFKEYVLLFTKLGQKGWGKTMPALDASKLLGMEVSWAPNTSIDIWIDDVVLAP